MKRLLVIVALTCLLSMSALAGDVPTVGNAPAPPPPTAPGDVPTVGAAVVLAVLSMIYR